MDARSLCQRRSAAALRPEPCSRPSPSGRLTMLAAPRTNMRVYSGDFGVQDLLDRDMKQAKVVDELSDSPPPKGPGEGGKEKESVVRSRRSRREAMAKATGLPETKGPKRCKEAIDQGLALFQEKKIAQAIDMFNLALELPGNGAYRLPGSPREYSCPSDAEEHAVLYNLACCYVQLGQRDSALTCLDAVLETGFNDYQTIRTDPDLAPLRGPELDLLLAKYTVAGPSSVLGKIFGKKQDGGVSATNKPWLMW